MGFSDDAGAVTERQAMNSRALRLALTDGLSFEDVAAALEREFPGAEFVKVPPANRPTRSRSHALTSASCRGVRVALIADGARRVTASSASSVIDVSKRPRQTVVSRWQVSKRLEVSGRRRYRAESGAVLTDRELAAHEVAAVLYVMSDHLPPSESNGVRLRPFKNSAGRQRKAPRRKPKI